MYKENSLSINNCIVSISQPHAHVCPIARDKTNVRVEIDAKLSVSMVDGFTYLDVLSWDAYHEGKRPQSSAEKYKQQHRHYPEVVLADQIYRTRDNRKYCKKHGIRLSGPKLGRPSNKQLNAELK